MFYFYIEVSILKTKNRKSIQRTLGVLTFSIEVWSKTQMFYENTTPNRDIPFLV